MSAPGGIGYSPSATTRTGCPRLTGHTDQLLGDRVVAARARRTRAASRRHRRRPIGPYSVRTWKSTSRNRGSLASAWKPPPPTPLGRLLTSPVWMRSPSSSRCRNVRGSSNGSGPKKCRRKNLISSLLRCPSSGNGASSDSSRFGPLSSRHRQPPCRRARQQSSRGRARADDHRITVHYTPARLRLAARGAFGRSLRSHGLLRAHVASSLAPGPLRFAASLAQPLTSSSVQPAAARRRGTRSPPNPADRGCRRTWAVRNRPRRSARTRAHGSRGCRRSRASCSPRRAGWNAGSPAIASRPSR